MRVSDPYLVARDRSRDFIVPALSASCLRRHIGAVPRPPTPVYQSLHKTGIAMTKGSKAAFEANEAFIFEIVSTSASYSFGLAMHRDDPDPYNEHLVWKIGARCMHPTRFAGRDAQVSVLGDRGLATEQRDRRKFKDGPYGVGAVDVGKSQFAVIASMPIDALWAMGGAVASGAVRYIVTHGPRLVRGKAMVRYIRFEGSTFELADWA